jgi:hypothetical protein
MAMAGMGPMGGMMPQGMGPPMGGMMGHQGMGRGNVMRGGGGGGGGGFGFDQGGGGWMPDSGMWDADGNAMNVMLGDQGMGMGMGMNMGGMGMGNMPGHMGMGRHWNPGAF